MLGLALSTTFSAIGAISSWARSGVGGVGTQARTNPLLALDCLDLLEAGHTAGEALWMVLESDTET